MMLVFDYTIIVGLAEIRILLSTGQVPMFLTVLTGAIFRILYTLFTVHALRGTKESHGIFNNDSSI
ncbi:hypothetical protein C444_06616 [Haloarcula japonica DSM 6131]|uniref:Uncharacterized protein n=1 Tax=Haloarcula japonica (strain ATCC 49778 / DSM 6131 / JCM 7785 / NBRC 101032 / NCIMB 13157 / TR-1) TaxID=1227453 RepID=M0LKA3_HALJT|nr:hypothetical protein C444_06616 [Haloarcula japonica DSM 6131]